MNLYQAALLNKPSLLPGHCIVEGCTNPTNNGHHAIQGRRKDPRVPKLHLCGSGTTGHHGQTHDRKLHHRWRTPFCADCFPDGCPDCQRAGWWEYLETPEPMKYEAALELSGWRRAG